MGAMVAIDAMVAMVDIFSTFDYSWPLTESRKI